MRKYFYTISLSTLAVMILFRMGVFDTKIIKVDDFTIKRPFLFRYKQKSSFDTDKDRAFLMFMGINKGITYWFEKSNMLKEYKRRTAFSLDENISNINPNECYVKKRILTEIKEAKIKLVKIFRYPYMVDFSEINEKRENDMIRQVCKNSKIVNINN